LLKVQYYFEKKFNEEDLKVHVLNEQKLDMKTSIFKVIIQTNFKLILEPLLCAIPSPRCDPILLLILSYNNDYHSISSEWNFCNVDIVEYGGQVMS
jgi:hypothetical protein